MADDIEDPRDWKIFPRNLTARADHLVRGNPISSRPESGVDNCYPGLELDQRGLDRAFLPGLSFEFHRSDGAVCVTISPSGPAAEAGLDQGDVPLYLWALMGRTTIDQNQDDPPAFFFHGLNGLETWRRVHDLMPGRIAVLLGPQAGFDAVPPNGQIIRLLDDLRDAGESRVSREPDGSVSFAIIVGERARFLDDEGVIDVEAYGPGELTRTLCSPWQFDFRDCGCFYWAANKPDLVASADGRHRYLNFLRADRAADPPPEYAPPFSGPGQAEMGYADVIRHWNELPVVLNDRESETFTASEPAVTDLMSRQEVIHELRYLASVEHALCVEYLYAHYSLDAPMRLAPDTAAQTRRIFAAGEVIFRIAVDEMRHLRWVNEALDALGEPPILSRAERIGRQLDQPFVLAPLTPEQLQWFIDVEAPSQEADGPIDGMYVRLHASIDRQPEIFPERPRLVHLMKLIIDEGEDHYQRFLRIREHLAGMTPEDYLRPLDDPEAGTTGAQLQKLGDENYLVLLRSLELTFALGDRAGGLLLEQARRAMFNLHETYHFMAGRNVRPAFRLPPQPVVGFAKAPAAMQLSTVDELQEGLAAAIDAVAHAGGPAERDLADRQQNINDVLFAEIRRLIEDGD